MSPLSSLVAQVTVSVTVSESATPDGFRLCIFLPTLPSLSVSSVNGTDGAAAGAADGGGGCGGSADCLHVRRNRRYVDVSAVCCACERAR